MKSAIADLPRRSMVMVSSAFISSRRARTRRSVSSVSLGTVETGAGLRRTPAREMAGVDRGPSFRFYEPFGSTDRPWHPARGRHSQGYVRAVNGINRPHV